MEIKNWTTFKKNISILFHLDLEILKKRVRVYGTFPAPFCGDSKTDKRKARGYLYEKKNKIWFTCHNCSKPIGEVENFFREMDETLYAEYVREKFQNPKKPEIVSQHTKIHFKERVDVDLPALSELDFFDPVYRYIATRAIPQEFYSILYSCSKFKSYTNSLLPNKFGGNSLKYEESRLVIPFFDKDGSMFAFAGRSIDPKAYLRYINIVLDENKRKLYGLERFNQTKDGFVVEGPLDSLFISNCLASAGGDISASLLGLDKDQFTLIYDNEPRSKTTKFKIEKAINQGFKVAIWPKSVVHKDINKMILEGYSQEGIEEIIKGNTFKGLDALNALYSWSKK